MVQDLELNPGDRPLTDDRRGLTEALRDVEGKRAGTRRPLLVVTGQSAPSRRFLRELACTTPAQARRLVVATGDAVAFNTVYRDRRVTWPIQDLPFAFVFFCHFDPIHNNTGDPDLAFLPEGAPPPDGEKDFNLSSTGTEDVLLNGAIIESLVQAFDRDGKPAADAGELSRRLADIRHRRGLFGYDSAGTPLFGPDGNRRAGAGENIVYLRPHFDGDRVLPEATIEVWVSRETIVGALHPWEAPRRAAGGFLRTSRGGRGGRPMSADAPPPAPPAGPPPFPRSRFWRYAQALTAPALLWALVAILLWEPVHDWIEGEDSYDKSTLEEWLDESRTFRKTLPEMTADYAQSRAQLARLKPPDQPTTPGVFVDPEWATANSDAAKKGEQIRERLRPWGTRRPRCTTASCRCSRRFIASR